MSFSEQKATAETFLRQAAHQGTKIYKELAVLCETYNDGLLHKALESVQAFADRCVLEADYIEQSSRKVADE